MVLVDVGAVLVLVVVATSLWVMFDASAHGLSWTWGVGCLVLWVVVFPWYLATRSATRQLRFVAAPADRAPGWKVDPLAGSRARYWNGTGWSTATDRSSLARSAADAPPSAVAGAWLPDPRDPEGRERYRQGARWTNRTRPRTKSGPPR